MRVSLLNINGIEIGGFIRAIMFANVREVCTRNLGKTSMTKPEVPSPYLSLFHARANGVPC